MLTIANVAGAAVLLVAITATTESRTPPRNETPAPQPLVTVLSPPNFKRTPVGRTLKSPALILTQLKAEPNAITDEEAWFASNRLALPVLASAPPGCATPRESRALRKAIKEGDRVLVLDGPDYHGATAVTACGNGASGAEYVFDFSRYELPGVRRQDGTAVSLVVNWAQEADGVLYVSLIHKGDSGYAKAAAGMTGYMAAFDTRSRAPLWHSAPLVANADNFVLIGDYIVSGYGFSAEPDFLFVLRRDTGAPVARVPIRSGPDYIIEKDGKLFVRTYDTNYVFEYSWP